MNILVIDEAPVIHAGVSALLTDRFGATVHGTGEIDEVQRLLNAHRFDAIIADVRIENHDAYAILNRNFERGSCPPLIVYTSLNSPTFIARGLAFGMNDYILKTDPADRLADSIGRLREGHPPQWGKHIERVRHLTQPRASETLPSDFPLSEREAQVLRHIGLGLSNKEIAASLSISVETVKEHVQNVLRKIGANDRTEAAVKAVKGGLLD
ncbi:MAG: response regulator transcription factor [Planctomycetota bacterium]